MNARPALTILAIAAAACGSQAGADFCSAKDGAQWLQQFFNLPLAGSVAALLTYCTGLGVEFSADKWNKLQEKRAADKAWAAKSYLDNAIAETLADLVQEWKAPLLDRKMRDRVIRRVREGWPRLAKSVRDDLTQLSAEEVGDTLRKGLRSVGESADTDLEPWTWLVGWASTDYEGVGTTLASTPSLSPEDRESLAAHLQEQFADRLRMVICQPNHQIAYREALMELFGSGFSHLAALVHEGFREQTIAHDEVRLRDERAAVDLARLLQLQNPAALSLPQSESGYVYSAESVAFQGRTAEFEVLRQFCLPGKQFQWFRLSGPAGAGKSRLALQWCKDARRLGGWHAGFLDLKSYDRAAWNRWTPERDTLIVLDYALDYPEASRHLLESLANNQAQFGFRVRVLLLAREERGIRWQLVLPQERNPQREYLWRRPLPTPQEMAERNRLGRWDANEDEGTSLPILPLGEAEQWAIAEDVWKSDLAAGVKQRTSAERDRFFRQALNTLRLQRLELFPLYVQFAARRAADPEADTSRPYTVEDLTYEVLQREAGNWTKHGVPLCYANLAILSTVLGGWKRMEATWPSPVTMPCLPKYHEFQYPVSHQVFALSRGVDIDQGQIPPLEPDVLGELFVLKRLLGDLHMGQGADARDQADAVLSYCAAALGAGSESRKVRATRFLIRAINSFPELATQARMTRFLDEPSILLSLILELEQRSDGGAAPTKDQIELGFALYYSVTDEEIRRLWPGALLNITTSCGSLEAVTGLRQIATTYPDDVAAHERLNKALANTLVRTTGGAAHALLDELRSFARAHPSSASRTYLAGGLSNALVNAAGDAADTLLNELRSLATMFPYANPFVHGLAKGLVNAHCRAAGDAAAALLDELRSLARNRHEDEPVRELLATGLFNALVDATGDAAHALLDELRLLARSNPDDIAIRRPLARGLVRAFNRATGDAATALLDELRSLSNSNPDVSIRLELARALLNMFDRASGDTATALLDELRSLSSAQPAAAIRLEVAKRLANALGRDSGDAASVLLDELRSLAIGDPEDAALREILAKGLLNTLVWATGEATTPLLDELRSLAQAHPRDAAVKHIFGLALLVAGHRVEDRSEALGLLVQFDSLGIDLVTPPFPQLSQALTMLLERWHFTQRDVDDWQQG